MIIFSKSVIRHWYFKGGAKAYLRALLSRDGDKLSRSVYLD
ncbi:MAG: hypothetical protein QXL78_06560 [Methanocellales archaeon]